LLGILVFGDNHWIVAGPCPDPAQATALARQWSIIRIGDMPSIPGWTMVTKAFREELQWAVVVPSPEAWSPAVTVLLAELADRGVAIQRG